VPVWRPSVPDVAKARQHQQQQDEARGLVHSQGKLRDGQTVWRACAYAPGAACVSASGSSKQCRWLVGVSDEWQ
jgi:hypothetical protein